jgi:DNA polymerase II small subunit
MDTLVGFFSSRNILADSRALEYISKKENPLEFARKVLDVIDGDNFLTFDFVKSVGENQLGSARPKTTSTTFQKHEVESGDHRIEVLMDVTGCTHLEPSVEGFSSLFRDRVDCIRNILKKYNPKLRSAIPIGLVRSVKDSDVSIIGIINEFRETRNGAKLVEVEDESGLIQVYAPKEDLHLRKEVEMLLSGEVIGIFGRKTDRGLLIAKQIFSPDIPSRSGIGRAENPASVVFAGDLHVGSKLFLRDNWDKFLRWLEGKWGGEKEREIARNVKYLVLPGDLVDGVGIYPNQEKELDEIDLFKQYQNLANELENLPDKIKIIIQPGNHDAGRPAEPQPAFYGEIKKVLSGTNCLMLGNPALFSIDGVKVLSYHGQSLMDFALSSGSFFQQHPIDIMKEMLRKRHLAPLWGGVTPLAPEKNDWMVIRECPDIFVTGHLHLAKSGMYKGITLLNASTWQAQTPYQKRTNFVPDPGKIFVTDLMTLQTRTISFC